MKYMKGSVLLALLLLLGFGGVRREAMECVAGAKSANARAEGETEMIGDDHRALPGSENSQRPMIR